MPDNVNTVVSEMDINIEEILNPGAASVMLPGEEKANLFSRKTEDLKFLDKPENDDDPPAELTDEEKTAKIASGELNPDGSVKIIPGTEKDIDDLTDQGEDKTKGRPRVDKQGLLELTKKLIEKKQLVPFDDDKKLEDYTLQDFEELFEANAQEKERKLREDVPLQFFDSLPDEMKYAAKYIADGGQDLKGLFRMLAATEEVRALDPKSDSETIVRTYLQATRFGDADEIQEEINAWKDRNELEAKALKFKPKLDAMQEEILGYKLQEQENANKAKQKQARLYQENVYKVLEPGEINGLKLDKKTQSMLYSGLTQPGYPSISGKQTNLLGHLLEKYQFMEPNHGLIAEALYLLADPEGYRAKVREQGEKKAVEKTVRSLKSEEQRKIAGTGSPEDEDEKRTLKIPRPNTGGFFKR